MFKNSLSGLWQSRRLGACSVLWSYHLPSQHSTSMGRCWCQELGKAIHMLAFLSQAKLALSHLSPWATRENPGQKVQRGVRFRKHIRRKAKGFDEFCTEEERFNNCLQTDEGLYLGPVRAWRPCVLGLHRMVMGAARLQQEKLSTVMHSGRKPVVLGCSRVCWARNCFIWGTVRKKDEGVKLHLGLNPTGNNLLDLAYISMCSVSCRLCWLCSWPRRNEQNNNNIRRSFPCLKPFIGAPTERKTGGEPVVWSEVYPHPESETCLPFFSWRAGLLLSTWPWWTTPTALLWGL